NALAVNTVSAPDTRDRDSAFASLDAKERLVQALYLDALGRAGSKSELDRWLAMLQGAGQQAVATAIEGSFEARDRLVKSWYVSYLGRQAQGGEELGWVNLLQSGQSEEQTLSQILGDGRGEFSQRAQTLIGSGSQDERFVQALYQVLLGRTASSGEANLWVKALAG